MSQQKQTWGICIHDYNASHQGELTIKRHDRILIGDMQDQQGWWMGSINGNGVLGYFPSDFVELEPEQPATTVKAPPPVPRRKKLPPKPPAKNRQKSGEAPPVANRNPNASLKGNGSSGAPPPVSKRRSFSRNSGDGSTPPPVQRRSSFSRNSGDGSTPPPVVKRSSIMNEPIEENTIVPLSERHVKSENSGNNEARMSLIRDKEERTAMSMNITSKHESIMLSKKTKRVSGKMKDFIFSKKDLNLEKKELTPGPELDRRRKNIARELLETEISYVQQLQRACDMFDSVLDAAQTDPTIPVDSVKTIFSSIKTILPINADICEKIRSRVDNFTQETLIGDIFVSFGPFLKIYSVYTNGYDQSSSELEKVENDEWFTLHCENVVNIESLLITPIQRIPRYNMLLVDLIKHTMEDHPDYENLKKALIVTRDAADHVNNSIKTQKENERLAAQGLGHLLAPHRTLILDSNIQVLARGYPQKSRRLQHEAPKKFRPEYWKFLLFNDQLVIVTSSINDKKKKKLKKKKNILKKGNEITDLSETPYNSWPLDLVWLSSESTSTGFDIVGPNLSLTVMLETSQMKNKWYDLIKANVEAVLKDHDYIEEMENRLFSPKRIGQYTYPSGETFDGEWDSGKMQGNGTWGFCGCLYEGSFREDVKEGHGTLEYPGGQVYVGNFSNGKPEGEGELISEHFHFTGTWVNGKRHGHV
eukprot:TRINITY_DN957_c0_g1_i4.p1 TRINITY_DN957_c0_g1~~TRINITY_DN957_c0_g1_i4.p1  ORF type:complete len:703 (-),score=164.90 TRINITY_DN957_c0_g1_i4:809-2917(-)